MHAAALLLTVLALLLGQPLVAQAQPAATEPGGEELRDRFPLGTQTLESPPAPAPAPSPGQEAGEAAPGERGAPRASDDRDDDGGGLLREPLVLAAGGAIALGALLLLIAAARGRRAGRDAPRRRRTVGPRTYALASHLGFRYSRGRDALVLRGVGRRWGPVLQRRRIDR